MEIRQSKSSEQLAAQKFYQKLGYKWNINPQDDVLIAKEKEEIIGIARINEENGYPILKEILIDKARRRQDVGTKMLKELDLHLQGKESYCIPYAHLKGFYKQLGYKAIEFDKAPTFLKKQLLFNNNPKKYSIKRDRVIIMRK